MAAAACRKRKKKALDLNLIKVSIWTTKKIGGEAEDRGADESLGIFKLLQDGDGERMEEEEEDG